MPKNSVRAGGVPVNPFIAFDAQHRSLTWELSRRDVLGRYRGASAGMAWSLISPLLMLGVYTLAFGYVLKSRWPGATGSTVDFALILFLGLLTHGLVAEVMTRSPMLIVGNSNLVKRIVFPLEVLPWTVVLATLFHLCANILVFVLLSALVRGTVPWTIVLLPLVLLPLVFLSVGLGWLLSSLGVYLRDIGQFMGVASTALLFLSSAIVPVSTLPANYQLLFHLNPLTFIIDQVRNVAYWGVLPDWRGLALYAAGSVLFSALALTVFRKLRRGFADVL
ncbi:ABC transporter permease [Lysobacter soli]|uniref:Transport permease protein n=1 Tax=Lysobacter soli TaxID=453783 RepID=A0A3D8VHX9_9GAMM|nr:ABC transporter permease [Lysobacter soli]